MKSELSFRASRLHFKVRTDDARIRVKVRTKTCREFAHRRPLNAELFAKDLSGRSRTLYLKCPASRQEKRTDSARKKKNEDLEKRFALHKGLRKAEEDAPLPPEPPGNRTTTTAGIRSPRAFHQANHHSSPARRRRRVSMRPLEIIIKKHALSRARRRL